MWPCGIFHHGRYSVLTSWMAHDESTSVWDAQPWRARYPLSAYQWTIVHSLLERLTTNCTDRQLHLLTSHCRIAMPTLTQDGFAPTLLAYFAPFIVAHTDKHCRHHLWSTPVKRKGRKGYIISLEFFILSNRQLIAWPSANTTCAKDDWRARNDFRILDLCPEWSKTTTSRLPASPNDCKLPTCSNETSRMT